MIETMAAAVAVPNLCLSQEDERRFAQVFVEMTSGSEASLGSRERVPAAELGNLSFAASHLLSERMLDTSSDLEEAPCKAILQERSNT